MPDRPSNPIFTAYEQEAWALPGLLVSKPLARRMITFCLDLIFPPRCAGCGRIDTVWCEQCQYNLDQLPLLTHVSQLPLFDGITSTTLHAGIIREAIQALKYDNARPAALPLGKRLSHQLEKQNWTIDIIVPVPLHTSRLAERGYNQAQLLAEVVTHFTAIPCMPDALLRARNTQSQVTVSAQARLSNVADAFSADRGLVAGQNVLVIDDVYTTGATLSACGEALLSAGAKAVYGLTVTAARN